MRHGDQHREESDPPPFAEPRHRTPEALLAVERLNGDGATRGLAVVAAEEERLDTRGRGRHGHSTAGRCLAFLRATAPGRVGQAPGARGSSSDRKSTRLNSSHPSISYAVFCLKKKKTKYLR